MKQIFKNQLVVRVASKAAVFVLTLSPAAALAQAAPQGIIPNGLSVYPQNTFEVVSTAIRWLEQAVLGVGILFFLLAAFQFLIAGGNKEKIATARWSFIYGLIALVIVLFIYAIDDWVVDVLLGFGL